MIPAIRADVPDEESLRIGSWDVFPSRYRLTSGAEEVSIEPRVMDLLVCLARTPGRVVRREDLQKEVWGEVIVNDEAVTRAVSELRSALGDNASNPAYVETIRGSGYRMIAPVSRILRTERDGKAPGRDRLGWLIASAAAGVAAVLLIVGTRDDKESDVARISVVPFTTFEGTEITPAISPDGSRVAYASSGGGDWDIYIKQANSERTVRLTSGGADETSPTWSPDGASIAFVSAGDGGDEVYSVPAIGGSARLILSTSMSIAGIDWSPDGRNLVVSARQSDDEPNRLYSLTLETGKLVPLTNPARPLRGDFSPAYSHDGTRIAFVRRERAGMHDVYLLEGGESRRVTNGELSLRGVDWISDSELVISSFRGGTFSLWRVDAGSGRSSWVPVFGERLTYPSVSSLSGDLVYEALSYDKDVWKIGANGAAEPLITSTRWDCEAYFSPDGRHLVFTSSRSGQLELWMSNAGGDELTQLTRFAGPFVGNPRWSPDGRYIAFYASPAGRSTAYVIDVLSRRLVRLTSSAHNSWVTGWSNDGRWVYVASDRSGSWELWKVPSDARGHAVLVNRSIAASESPDGKYLYFVRPDEPGLWRSELRGGVPQGPAESILPDLDAVDWSNWFVSDQGVYFVDRTSGKAAISFLDFASAEVRTIAEVPNIAGSSLAVSPDGKSILYARIERLNSDLMLAREAF